MNILFSHPEWLPWRVGQNHRRGRPRRRRRMYLLRQPVWEGYEGRYLQSTTFFPEFAALFSQEDANIICEARGGRMVDMDEGKGINMMTGREQSGWTIYFQLSEHYFWMMERRSQLSLHYTMLQSSLRLSVSLAFSGTAKNNAIKALLSDYVPSEPGNPGMQ